MSNHPWSESLSGTNFGDYITEIPSYKPPWSFAGRGGAALAQRLFSAEDPQFAAKVQQNFTTRAGDTVQPKGVAALTTSKSKPIPASALTPEVLASGAAQLVADRVAKNDARHARGGAVVGDTALLALLIGGGVGTARAISKLRAIRESRPDDELAKASGLGLAEFNDTMTTLPHGVMYPLLGVAATGGLAAGLNGMDVLSDKVRSAILRRRKQKAIAEFQQMLSTVPEKQSSMGRAVDAMADMLFDDMLFEKSADVPEWLSALGEHGQGLLASTILMSALGGAAVGKKFALKDDPNQAVLSALSLAVKRRQMSRPPIIQLQQVPEHKPAGTDMVAHRSGLVRAPFDTPVVLPGEPSDVSDEDVQAKDLSKLSSLLKLALEVEKPGAVPGSSAPVINGGRGWRAQPSIPMRLLMGGDNARNLANTMQGASQFVDNDLGPLKDRAIKTMNTLDTAGTRVNNVATNLEPASKMIGGFASKLQNVGSLLGGAGSKAINWMSGAAQGAGREGGELLGNLLGGGYAKQ